MISVLILTFNEETNLSQCLESVQWSNDVVVLDSFSEDRTKEIAKESGARVFERKFDNYASQRSYGLNDIKFKNQWVLMVDADEQVSPELEAEIKTLSDADLNKFSLFRLKRKDYFFGRWIKHSSGYPTWFGRLIKVGHVSVERTINEEYVTTGKVGYLKNHLHHYPFNKGFASWLEKHNRYSSMEAELLVNKGLSNFSFTDLINNDPSLRRRAVKSIVYRLPGRPLLMFIALYIFRLGFLDGKAGIIFCVLRSYYEFMINLKVKEIRRRQKNLPI